jgi:hypothetical protein
MRKIPCYFLPVVLVVLISSCAAPTPITTSIPTLTAPTPTNSSRSSPNSFASPNSQSTLPAPSFSETEQTTSEVEPQTEETLTPLPWVAFEPGDAEKAEDVLLEFLLHIARYEVDQAAVLSAEPYENVQNQADYFRMYCEQWERCYQPRQVIFLNPGLEMEGNWFGVEFEQDDGKLWKPATFCCGTTDWVIDPIVVNLAPLSRYSVVKTADGNFLVNHMGYAMFDY